ncbi:MAG: DUF1566 domain-containing protein [Thermodesulfobacteriota bacterium]|nr:DUF1566 domain-containing protein [Thermodesulfobacteriota bacterium]
MKKSAMTVLVFMAVFVSHLVFAGDIESPGPPSEGSKMPSLLNIYDYLNYGTSWTDSGNFTEPAAEPGSTMKSTKNIYDDSKAKFDSCNATASDVAETKKFFSTQSGNWGVTTGSALISTGDASAPDVLTGKTFSKSGSAGLTGTMTNNGAVTYTPTTADQTVAAGYHNGSGKVEGDADLAAENIKKDVDIFGKVGTYEGVAKVAKTGQTGCWNEYGVSINCTNTGQDGDLQKGVAWPNPRFTANTGDETGTVTDKLTGLMWAQNASAEGQKTWAAALTYCNDLSLGGHDDWRLPNVKELLSLIDWAYCNPALSNDAGTGQWTNGAGSSFFGVKSSDYWSSTTDADADSYDTDHAWIVYLRLGCVFDDPKDHDNYVWPVRDRQ